MYKEFCLLLGFVSRLPIRIRWDSKEEDWGRSFRLLPLWGLVLGTMIASVLAIFSLVSIPVAAVCGVGFCVLITGGLHLDGLMDVADGLGSCQDREKTFAIMKDSLVGSMGVTAAVILLLSKFALYWQLIADWRIFWVLPAALVFSRWLVAWAIFTFPAARPTGLGATLHNYFSKNHFLLACFLGAAFLLLFREWQIIVAVLFSLPICYGICLYWQKRLGGLTGDCYGALAEWSEIIFLGIYFLIQALLSLAQSYYLF